MEADRKEGGGAFTYGSLVWKELGVCGIRGSGCEYLGVYGSSSSFHGIYSCMLQLMGAVEASTSTDS